MRIPEEQVHGAGALKAIKASYFFYLDLSKTSPLEFDFKL